MQKYYVLDANILIHDPQSIFHFADNTVIIPVGVISEIDRFKKEMTDRGFNARAVVRLLDGLRNGQSLSQGIALENGGHLRVYCEPDAALRNGHDSADTELLRVASAIRRDNPATPVVIVTKDINLRIRADAAGLRAEDYESDRVRLADVSHTEFELTVSPQELETIRQGGPIPLPSSDRKLTANTYGMVRPSNGGKNTALVRVNAAGDQIIPVRQSEKGLVGIRPRNKEQYYAVDAILDDEISLVTLMGKAGTGKTLLAIAGALQVALRRKQLRGILVARPVVPMGRDLGFLPGDVSKKLEPWMKPVTDTIEFLLHTGGPVRSHSDVASLMRSGLIEIQPLTYIRGRSISNRFVVIDEAQNLTPLEVKTVITRIGHEAKVILTGDPYQIDNPYVDATSNGFTYLANRFRSQPLAAHVQLVKGERSAVAELAANLL